MTPLNLPQFDYKVKKIDGKVCIYDIIRRKYVVITPEEWVRQHVVHWLIQVHQYPKALIALETGLKYQKLHKRTDVVVYDRTGAPFMLVECKAPTIAIDTKVLDQALRYNAVLKVKYVMLSNGLEHYVFEIKNDGQLVELSNVPSIP